jgi:paraquat-inducible protein B
MVTIHVRRGSIRTLGGEKMVAHLSDAEVVRQQVAEGLRAQLKSSSPIAGQTSIELDFMPERPPRFSGVEPPYPEVPTAATGMELLNEQIEATLKKISEVPVDEVLNQLQGTLVSVQSLVDSGDVRGALRGLNATLLTANRTLETAGTTLGGVDGLLADFRGTSASTAQTMERRSTATSSGRRTCSSRRRGRSARCGS